MIALLSFSFLIKTESLATERPKTEDIIKLEKQAAIEKKESSNLEKKAAVIGKELVEIRHKMVNVAKKIQDQEEVLSNLELRLANFKKEQAEMLKKLDTRNHQIIKLVSVLQNLAIKPTETMIVQPLQPIDIIRSISLIRDSIPYIESSAKSIKEDLSKLASLRATIQSQYSRIAMVRNTLDNEHSKIQDLHKKRVLLKKETEIEGKKAASRAEKLAEQADDLKDLLKALGKEKAESEKNQKTSLKTNPNLSFKTPEDSSIGTVNDKISFANAKGSLPPPVRGNIITVYGEVTKTGSHARGITIKTRSNAQVIAPFDGVVLFAGSFRGYGQLLIIEHGDGYHTLLAGMDKIDVNVNQGLLAGEPIGLMSKEKEPSLYLELRKNGQPVNPKPWLASVNNDKVS